MNNNNEQYGIELKLLTDKFKAKMQQVSTSVQQWANNTKQNTSIAPDIEVTDTYTKLKQLETVITNLRREMKDLDPNSEAFIEFANQLREAELEAKKLNNQLKKTNTLNFPTKKATKFLLSLFSIRSAWSLISRAASTYIGENEQLNSQIQLTASLLGNTLAPAIKSVIDFAQYAAIVMSELIRIFTGYDAVAGAITSANKKIASSGKQASQSLASFDTISNLSSNASGTSSNITSMTDALEEFQKKVNEVRKVFNEYETPIKAATIALGVFAGAAMLAKLASLYGSLKTVLGVAGTGAAAAGASGLLGILGVLTGIAAIGVITVAIALDVQQFKNQWDEWNQQILDNIGWITKQEDTLDTLYASEAAHRTAGHENLAKSKTLLAKILGISEEHLETAINVTKNMDEQLVRMEELEEQTEMTLDDYKKMEDFLKKQLLYQVEVSESLDKDSENYKEIQKTTEQYVEKLKEVQTKINDLTNTDYTINADMNVNTTKAKNSVSSFFSSLGSKLSTVSLFSTIGSSIKSAFNSFDVGTNYVPNDQLAMIHKGEMVVPAKYNPATSGINGNEETNYLLGQLLTTLENKNFNVQIGEDAVGKASVNYINKKSRQIGGSVIR